MRTLSKDMKRVYLDHIAATPLHPEAREAMRPFLEDRFGNPQSLHALGREARAAVDEARGKTAALIGAGSDRIVFTASGSEANVLAVKGLSLAGGAKKKRIVVSAVEHVSVLRAAAHLSRYGYSIAHVPVDRQARVDPAAVAEALTDDTVLVSVQTASSEVGTIQPVGDIAALCRDRGILFHTDAVAAAGNIPLDVRKIGADALSLAADQFYGPKGAAALYLAEGVRLVPLIEGGIQENGRRSGTENVAALAGLGRAADIAAAEMERRTAAMVKLRNRMLAEIPERIPRTIVTGHPEHRLPHHASFCVEFVEGEAMLLSLDFAGVAASSGSACASKSLKVSQVLMAMGLDHALAQGSLIFSLIDGADDGDIDHLMKVFPPIVEKLRAMSPLYARYIEERRS
jgi:cysteine desulfurase